MFQRFFILCFLALFLGCAKKTPPSFEQKKPLLLVSIAPYKFLTEKIAGSDFEVAAVVPTAANPHAFEPTAKQVQEISKGQVWFLIGESFEKKVLNILKKRNPDLLVQDLREGISLIEDQTLPCCCSKDHLDRHIWLSPKLAIEQGMLIEEVLSKKFPEHKDLFQKNLKSLTIELQTLDTEIHDLLKNVEKRTVLVSHPAFAYFCKDYGLEQLSIEHEGKDPRPKHLEEILKRASSETMEVALALPQHNNKGAEMVAEKLHIPIHLIDPYSSNYFETMRKLAHYIAEPNGNSCK